MSRVDAPRSAADHELERMLRHADRAVAAPPTAALALDSEREDLPVREEVRQVCAEASQHALRIDRARASGVGIPTTRSDGRFWLDGTSRRMQPLVPELNARELDLLTGCLTRVESALRRSPRAGHGGGRTPQSLRHLRRRAGRRLGIPGY